MQVILAAKLIDAELATVALGRSGVGTGVVFGQLLSALARNPSLAKQLFVYAILGFALTEAIALFGLISTGLSVVNPSTYTSSRICPFPLLHT